MINVELISQTNLDDRDLANTTHNQASIRLDAKLVETPSAAITQNMCIEKIFRSSDDNDPDSSGMTIENPYKVKKWKPTPGAFGKSKAKR